MGVKGLTNWMKKQPELGSLLELPTTRLTSIPWILDGLGWIWSFDLFQADAIRGGNYLEMRKEVRLYIEYWRAVGLDPIVVWDGPCDETKADTTSDRSNQALTKLIALKEALSTNLESTTANTTTTTSDLDEITEISKLTTKATLLELQEVQQQAVKNSSRLPPLAYFACLAELSNLDVKMYFAEGEADSPIAELAEKLGGFIVGQDSDYFIFNSKSRGYVPLSDIQYGQSLTTKIPTVTKFSKPRMRFYYYNFELTAHSFGIPPKFLPIMASLFGNDLTDYGDEIALNGPRPADLKWRVRYEDITRILSTLYELRHTNSATTQVEISEILRLARKKLFLRKSTDSKSVVQENLLIGALSYSLVPISYRSKEFPLNPRKSDSLIQAKCRAAYRVAFSKGRFTLWLLQVLKQHKLEAAFISEDIDSITLSISVGRSITKVLLAILESTVGLDGVKFINHLARVGQEFKILQAEVVSLESILSNLSPPLSTSTPVTLLPQKKRMEFFFALLPTPPSTLTKSNHISTNSFSTLIIAIRHLNNTLEQPWTKRTILSALIVAVLLSVEQNLPLLSTPTTLTNSFASLVLKPPTFNQSLIQRSSELVSSLYWISLLAESLLLISNLPPASDHFNGRMFHSLLELDENDWELMISKLEGEVMNEVNRLYALVVE